MPLAALSHVVWCRFQWTSKLYEYKRLLLQYIYLTSIITLKILNGLISNPRVEELFIQTLVGSVSLQPQAAKRKHCSNYEKVEEELEHCATDPRWLWIFGRLTRVPAENRKKGRWRSETVPAQQTSWVLFSPSLRSRHNGNLKRESIALRGNGNPGQPSVMCSLFLFSKLQIKLSIICLRSPVITCQEMNYSACHICFPKLFTFWVPSRCTTGDVHVPCFV